MTMPEEDPGAVPFGDLREHPGEPHLDRVGREVDAVLGRAPQPVGDDAATSSAASG